MIVHQDKDWKQKLDIFVNNMPDRHKIFDVEFDAWMLHYSCHFDDPEAEIYFCGSKYYEEIPCLPADAQ